MNFLRSFLAAFLALIIFSIIGFFVLFGILVAVTAEEKVVVNDKSVLKLNLDVRITEQEIEDPFEGLPIPGTRIPSIGLLRLKEVISHAADNPKIEGILLHVNYPMTGFTTIEEIRQSILDFRKTGKWVIAYAEAMTEQAYYLASAADKVYLNREGEVEFNGLVVEIAFYKRLFDKLEIKPEIFRVGEFKSAVEPFMLEKMSDENRLQLTELINSKYEHVINRISEQRNIPVEKLKEISDQMLAYNGQLAVAYGLVDSLVYYDVVLSELRERLTLVVAEKIEFV
jgi:protease-4